MIGAAHLLQNSKSYKETNHLSAGTSASWRGERAQRRTRGRPSAPLVGEGSERNGVPEVGQALNEAMGLLLLGATVEVIGAEVLICGSVLEHVIDGGEEGSGDRHDFYKETN